MFNVRSFSTLFFQPGLARNKEENAMANKIMSEQTMCLAYNSPSAQEEARACVPLDSLRQRVDLDLLSPTHEQKSDPDWAQKAGFIFGHFLGGFFWQLLHTSTMAQTIKDTFTATRRYFKCQRGGISF